MIKQFKIKMTKSNKKLRRRDLILSKLNVFFYLKEFSHLLFPIIKVRKKNGFLKAEIYPWGKSSSFPFTCHLWFRRNLNYFFFHWYFTHSFRMFIFSEYSSEILKKVKRGWQYGVFHSSSEIFESSVSRSFVFTRVFEVCFCRYDIRDRHIFKIK